VELYLKSVPAKLSPDLVVLDPPRSGLGESVVRGLASLRSPRITYVSCDPATLARDLGGLLKAGYRVEQAHIFDLFPQTFHLETVLRLAR
jgi:23S rRNA (uracil1939-C5)-methyltransferase